MRLGSLRLPDVRLSSGVFGMLPVSFTRVYYSGGMAMDMERLLADVFDGKLCVPQTWLIEQ